MDKISSRILTLIEKHGVDYVVFVVLSRGLKAKRIWEQADFSHSFDTANFGGEVVELTVIIASEYVSSRLRWPI